MRARVRENYEEVINKANHILNIFGLMFSEGKIALTLKEIITEINNLIFECSNLISNFLEISREVYDVNNLKRLTDSTYNIRAALANKLTDLHEEKTENIDNIDQDPSPIIIIKTEPPKNTNISFHEWYENQRRCNEKRGRVLHRDHLSAPMGGPR